MARCAGCGVESRLVSRALGCCADCIRNDVGDWRRHAESAHEAARRPFDLPPTVPQATSGRLCQLCGNECRIADGERGYCGLRINHGGRLVGATADRANVSWYYDPLPTNCVADWVCAAGTGAGYPQFAHRPGPEFGYANLAVFYQACSFDCLFCQNWHYRERALDPATIAASRLARAADRGTSCICYFGGDPSPQMAHSLRAARLALSQEGRQRPDRILRVCWETNGSVHPALLRQALDLAEASGGCVKFDLKAWDDRLHRALTSSSNARTLSNFAVAAARSQQRPEPPLVVASTLLVPGYVDAAEVAAIAAFIASFDADIPYTLLVFHPGFQMADLPVTPRPQVEACLAAARAAGLRRIRIGNAHLLL